MRRIRSLFQIFSQIFSRQRNFSIATRWVANQTCLLHPSIIDFIHQYITSIEFFFQQNPATTDQVPNWSPAIRHSVTGLLQYKMSVPFLLGSAGNCTTAHQFLQPILGSWQQPDFLEVGRNRVFVSGGGVGGENDYGIFLDMGSSGTEVHAHYKAGKQADGAKAEATALAAWLGTKYQTPKLDDLGCLW